MTDIAHKVRVAYHLDTVHETHPLRLLCDECERLHADSVELAAVRMALGGDAYWMDPPDGGNVTLAEMVGRANAAGRLADEALRLLRGAKYVIEAACDATRVFPMPRACQLTGDIDALLAKEGA